MDGIKILFFIISIIVFIVKLMNSDSGSKKTSNNYKQKPNNGQLKPLKPHIPQTRQSRTTNQTSTSSQSAQTKPEVAPAIEIKQAQPSFTFSVDEYWKEAFKDRSDDNIHYYQDPWFLENFPEQTIGQCPFCNKKTKVKIDNASLSRTRFNREAGEPGAAIHPFSSEHTSETPWYSTCEHLALVDGFLNFNENYPKDIPEDLRTGLHGMRNFSSEAPGLMTAYMNARLPEADLFSVPDDIAPIDYYNYLISEEGEAIPKLDIRAVISSIPWFAIEGDTFVNRHTAYYLCYYIPEKNQNLQSTELNQTTTHRMQDVLLALSNVSIDNLNGWLIDDLDFDLQKYVERGDLYWFDGELRGKDDLHLREFPYKKIKGRKNLTFLIDPVLV